MPFRTVAAGVLRPAGADALQDDAGTARGDPNLLAGGESAADQQRGERLQLSFLMPILRSEVARIDVTPEEVILVDRMGKRYVQASRQELKGILPKKATFQHLEKLLYAASRPGGKNTLTGSELGIPSLEKGKIELTDFSTKPFNLTPTQLSSRYQRVELYEILELLMSL